jgi:Flp pilus assembly protein TadB
MMQRLVRRELQAANDNLIRARGARPRSAQDLLRMPFIPRPANAGASSPSGPRRRGLRPLLIVALSGLVLVALCGAFLLGLAFVGLFAAAVAAIELVRRHLRRPPRLIAFDQPVAG